ncbi:MAG: hypothetical protein D6805_02815 [Planctomycetota bacterium]|nr:MAG: hypothetical protein D6805_02815 [Planctomycetota bacterium]
MNWILLLNILSGLYIAGNVLYYSSKGVNKALIKNIAAIPSLILSVVVLIKFGGQIGELTHFFDEPILDLFISYILVFLIIYNTSMFLFERLLTKLKELFLEKFKDSPQILKKTFVRTRPSNLPFNSQENRPASKTTPSLSTFLENRSKSEAYKLSPPPTGPKNFSKSKKVLIILVALVLFFAFLAFPKTTFLFVVSTLITRLYKKSDQNPPSLQQQQQRAKEQQQRAKEQQQRAKEKQTIRGLVFSFVLLLFTAFLLLIPKSNSFHLLHTVALFLFSLFFILFGFYLIRSIYFAILDFLSRLKQNLNHLSQWKRDFTSTLKKANLEKTRLEKVEKNIPSISYSTTAPNNFPPRLPESKKISKQEQNLASLLAAIQSVASIFYLLFLFYLFPILPGNWIDKVDKTFAGQIYRQTIVSPLEKESLFFKAISHSGYLLEIGEKLQKDHKKTLQKLQQDPRIQPLLQEPSIQKLIQNPDFWRRFRQKPFQTLNDNREIQSLLQNPSIRQKLLQIPIKDAWKLVKT